MVLFVEARQGAANQKKGRVLRSEALKKPSIQIYLKINWNNMSPLPIFTDGFLFSICIDRYLAVVHASSTLHRWRTIGAARCVSATVWFIAVVVTYSFQVKRHTKNPAHTG